MNALNAPSPGSEANRAGKVLEFSIETCMRSHGFHVTTHGADGNNADMFFPQRLIRQAPYKSIYGARSTSEFLLVDERCRREIRIECKWQQSEGSVDEKLAYIWLNVQQDAYPENEIILVIDGGGAREKAVDWLKAQAKGFNRKRVHVFTMTEFHVWARDFVQGKR